MSNKNVRKLNIDGREYSMRVMPPTKAMYFSPKVASALAGVLGGMAGKLSGDLLKTDNEELGALVGDAVTKIDPAKFTELMKEAFSYEVFYGSKRLSNETFLDDHFSEYPGDMFPVATWAIWEHSKGFFMQSVNGFRQVFLAGPTS